MKKNKFIKELIAEGKIRLVSPSNEVSAAYAKKSLNSLKASQLLLDQSLLEEATSMLYYAMYNKVMSLFFLVGIKCENHNASIILFEELFKLDNYLLSFAKQERVDKQYYTDFIITRSEIIDLTSKAESFLDSLDHFIDLMTGPQKNQFREEFRSTYL
jgi:uncharacterized protein (UPF0332 family)